MTIHTNPSEPNASHPGGIRGWWNKHGYILPSIASVTVIYIWFVTFGTWRLFEPHDEHSNFADRFFNAQAAALLQGRWDVPPETIEFEAFVHDGKHYGYFGVATAVLRLPFLQLFPNTANQWNRFISTLACIINLVAAYLILLTVRQLFLPGTDPRGSEKWLYSLFIWIAGLGSANIYLGSRSFMYHEPIIWGAAFALLFYCFFLRYLIRPQVTTLLLACTCSLLAFLTRATQGAGTLLCLGLFAGTGLVLSCRPKRPSWPAFWRLFDGLGLPNGAQTKPHVALAVVAMGVTVGCYMLVNYAKFDTFSGMPLHLYKRYPLFNEMATLERIEGRFFHLSNARTMLYNYFAPSKIEFSKSFPWAYVAREAKIFPEAKLDLTGEFSSLTASQPALLLLAVIGLPIVWRPFSKEKQLRLPLLGAAVAAGFNFLFICISERYTHDFYPFLILAGAAGLHTILTFRAQALRTAACLILVPLALYSAYVNTAFALVHQREISSIYGNPWTEEKLNEFRHWRRTIDAWVAGDR
jgi:hypothetical protein